MDGHLPFTAKTFLCIDWPKSRDSTVLGRIKPYFMMSCLDMDYIFVVFLLLLGPLHIERQPQCCYDANNTALIENNGVAPEVGCNPFWSDSIVFIQSSTASAIAALMLTLSVKGPLDCERST